MMEEAVKLATYLVRKAFMLYEIFMKLHILKVGVRGIKKDAIV